MPPKTRSKGGSKGGASAATRASSTSATTPSTSRYTLAAPSPNPPKVFILPRKAAPEARIASLPNPRYAKPTRYLVCPESGTYEFTRIAAPSSTPRSWLIEGSAGGDVEARAGEDGDDFGTYVTKDAELFVATPVDPLFLVLPTLAAQSTSSKTEKRMFLSSYDHLDPIAKASPHFSEILRWGNVRTLFESRMAVVCDTVEAGDESMLRLSEEKLLRELLSKAQRMSEGSLPPSMEEKFVTKALEAPVLGVKRQNTNGSLTTESSAPESGSSTPKVQSEDSQTSTTSTATVKSSESEVSTAATSVADEGAAVDGLAAAMRASPEVTQLQRLRTAFDFICSSYIAPSQAGPIRLQLSQSKSLVDFTPLDEYLAQVTTLRQEAMAARSMGDYSRKRVVDEEEVMERAEKKRKKEEEDKRQKAGESRGVRDLKKANTTGMRKMSDFFKKK